MAERPMTAEEKAKWLDEHRQRMEWLEERERERSKRSSMPHAGVPDDDEDQRLFGDEKR